MAQSELSGSDLIGWAVGRCAGLGLPPTDAAILQAIRDIPNVNNLGGYWRPIYVCPHCGEMGGSPVDWDYGVDPETNYYDCGEGCTLCCPRREES